MEMRGLGVKEGECLGGGVDAASDEELGEDEGQTRVAGERSRWFRMGLGEDPALGRARASGGGEIRGVGWAFWGAG
jgi:hypothetical protein